MKKIILLLISITSFVGAFAQKIDYRKPASLGVNFFFNDFTTAADIKKNGLGRVIRDKNLFKKDRLESGIALSFLNGLSNNVDFIGTLGGSFVNYPASNSQVSSSVNNGFLLETTASVNVKLLSDKYLVVPYADFGVGVSKFQSNYAAFVPVGLGL